MIFLRLDYFHTLLNGVTFYRDFPESTEQVATRLPFISYELPNTSGQVAAILRSITRTTRLIYLHLKISILIERPFINT